MTTLINPSFEDGWTDIQSGPASLNQQPNGWELRWLEPGELLWDSNDEARGVPECRHLNTIHLPPNEQPGAPDALILDGEWTYKIFHAGSSFGARLKQTVTGLRPGSNVRVVAPIQVHRHKDNDPWAVEAGVWINEYGGWHSYLGNREWRQMELVGQADENGEAKVVIRVKSKWDKPKDFFIDAITFQGIPAELPPPPPPEPEPERTPVYIVTLYDDGTGEWEDV